MAKKTAAPVIKKPITFTPDVPKQITFWSYSRYADYQLCPLKAKLKHLDKIQEPPNAAMSRGGEIGKQAEGYIKGAFKKLAPELMKFKKEFAEFRALYKKLNDAPEPRPGAKVKAPKPGAPRAMYPMTVEDTWAFTKDWSRTTWNDWVGCWVRIKLDCAHEVKGDVLVVTDFKTGKFRPDQNESYVEQLELYALGALLTHPGIKQVKPRLMYTDTGIIFPLNPDDMVFTHADVPKLKALWDQRTRKMLLDKSFVPRPNDKCHWCHYRRANKVAGGPPGSAAAQSQPGGGGQCKF